VKRGSVAPPAFEKVDPGIDRFLEIQAAGEPLAASAGVECNRANAGYRVAVANLARFELARRIGSEPSIAPN
jgi:hypothetical protein